jgi:hypothetical protein
MQINEIQLLGEDDVILAFGADLKMKKKQTIKADPFGAATVDNFEDSRYMQTAATTHRKYLAGCLDVMSIMAPRILKE